jgi:hypothetical protein
MEIPGHHFPPIILSALAIYLASLSMLVWPGSLHLPKLVNTSRETRVNPGKLPNVAALIVITIKQNENENESYCCIE